LKLKNYFTRLGWGEEREREGESEGGRKGVRGGKKKGREGREGEGRKKKKEEGISLNTRYIKFFHIYFL
jgi:hypothetical protein